MSNFQGLYNIRAATAEDMSFVMATFLRGLYYGDSWFSSVPKNIFMENYKRIAETAWNSPNVAINVACLPEDPNVILGYSITSADGQALVWVFVKTAWRKQGIGKSLVPNNVKYVTHLTALGKTLLNDKLPNVQFNPFF